MLKDKHLLFPCHWDLISLPEERFKLDMEVWTCIWVIGDLDHATQETNGLIASEGELSTRKGQVGIVYT